MKRLIDWFDFLGVQEHSQDEVASYRRSVVSIFFTMGFFLTLFRMQAWGMGATLLASYLIIMALLAPYAKLYVLHHRWYPVNHRLLGPFGFGLLLPYVMTNRYTLPTALQSASVQAVIFLVILVLSLEWLHAPLLPRSRQAR